MLRIRTLLSGSLVAPLLVALSPTVSGASGSSYTFSGKTNSDNTQSTHSVTCPSGSYVASSAENQGTVFNEPDLDTSGTDSRVNVADSPTTTVDWGHSDSQLATGIALGVGNGGKGAAKSLPFRITITCTNSMDDAWVVVSSAGVSTSSNDSKNETSQNFSGTTQDNKTIYRHNFNCAPGYVKNNGVNSGTIWDHPYIDDTGTDPHVVTDNKATGAVEWDHFGSRLANAILVVAGYNGFTDNKYPFSFTIKCTTDQKDAWVILAIVPAATSRSRK